MHFLVPGVQIGAGAIVIDSVRDAVLVQLFVTNSVTEYVFAVV